MVKILIFNQYFLSGISSVDHLRLFVLQKFQFFNAIACINVTDGATNGCQLEELTPCRNRSKKK